MGPNDGALGMYRTLTDNTQSAENEVPAFRYSRITLDKRLIAFPSPSAAFSTVIAITSRLAHSPDAKTLRYLASVRVRPTHRGPRTT